MAINGRPTLLKQQLIKLEIQSVETEDNNIVLLFFVVPMIAVPQIERCSRGQNFF